MKKIKNQRGVTLIELLVVLVIIILLAAIALPRFMGTIQSAKRTAFDQTVANLHKVATMHIIAGGEDCIWSARGGEKARATVQGAHESWYLLLAEWPVNNLKTGDFVVEIKGSTIMISPDSWEE